MMSEYRLKEQFFDFEVFPQWWCCVIGRYPADDKEVPESLKDDFIVITSKDAQPRETLMSVLNDPEYVSMGYNIKKYDNIIYNGIVNGFTPHQLRVLNDCIINPEAQYESYEHMRIAPFAKKRYNGTNFTYQDLIDDNTGSLKEKESCMKLDIRESTVPFDKEDLTDEDITDIISYCKHDVWASMKFYQVILKPFVETKLLVGKVFGLPINEVYKATNAILSAKALSAKRTSFKDSERQDIELPKQIEQYIRYALPSDVVKRVCMSPDKFTVKLFGNDVVYANGGIHSTPCDCLKIQSNDEWVLFDVDAASFYPAIMINFGLLSRAVAQPEKFRHMYQSRLDFKKVIEPFEEKYGKQVHLAPIEEYNHYKECKETSQAYKLILNTTYGASGNKYLDLYDPYMQTKICRVGQLLLTALANNIYNQVGKDNCAVIQTNTDGIFLYIRRDKIDLLDMICAEFTRVTNILLEREAENVMWQRDVSNYILWKANGRFKNKGGFFVVDMQQPGYNRVRPLDAYICRNAVIEYLHTGKDIVEHIYNERDLSMFAVTCHKGSFSGICREFNDGREPEILHKCNRVYASLNTSLGEIKKLKKFKGEVRRYKAPGCPPHCELINEALDKYDFDKVREDIDYMWYIDETVNMLSDIWHEMQGSNIVKLPPLLELD